MVPWYSYGSGDIMFGIYNLCVVGYDKMNKQSRAVYVKRHLQAMKLLEQHAHKLVLRCYRKQRPRILEFVVSGIPLDELPDHTKQFFKDSITPLWKATLKVIWQNAAQEAEGNTKEWLAPNAVKKGWEDSADQWMKDNAGAKIDGITDTDQQWLANTLRSGESEGKSTTEMAADLSDSFDNMSIGRAGTIARTETASAYNYASLDTAQDIMPDGATKVWEVTSDNPRPWHEEADGQEVPIEEPFDVDGEDMDHPGDPDGSAENVVNCMCVMSYNYPTEAAPGEEVPEGEGEEAVPAEGEDVRAEAAALYNNAAERESETTAMMTDTAASTDGNLEGLDFALKSEDSTARKIAGYMAEEPDLTAKEAAEGVTDSLRYTIIYDPENFVDNVLESQKTLESEGYEPLKMKNYFGDNQAGGYQGYNTVWTDKEGNAVELQYHTDESLRIKEETHLIYEKSRVEPDLDEKERMEQEMDNKWKDFTPPANYDELPTLAR